MSETKAGLTMPTVHMNGTSFDVLWEQNDTARAALRAAIEALQDAWPHGRDYYPQSDTAITTAAEEHRARYLALCSVRSDLDQIAMHLDGQRR